MTVKQKPRVLVVDDEPSVLFTYRLLFEEQGYDVVAALSSEEATTALKDGAFQMVLCDLSLERDRTGFDVIGVARERSPSVPCVLLTGYANKEIADRAERNNVAVLYKPIEVDELLSTIQRMLRDSDAN
jgi:DNA-binding NtrC family response regulator